MDKLRDPKYLIGIFVFIVLACFLIIYYSNDEEARKKMKTGDIFLQCVLPGIVIGCILIAGIYYSTEPKKDIYLDEDFWS